MTPAPREPGKPERPTCRGCGRQRRCELVDGFWYCEECRAAVAGDPADLELMRTLFDRARDGAID